MRTYTMIERGGGWEALRGHYSRWHRSAMPARYVRMCILVAARRAIPVGEVGPARRFLVLRLDRTPSRR
jgi:hypothetical protein